MIQYFIYFSTFILPFAFMRLRRRKQCNHYEDLDYTCLSNTDPTWNKKYCIWVSKESSLHPEHGLQNCYHYWNINTPCLYPNNFTLRQKYCKTIEFDDPRHPQYGQWEKTSSYDMSAFPIYRNKNTGQEYS